MSMNVYIAAEREVTFRKRNGETGTDTQTVKFDAWQTPTKVTYEIVGSADPAQAYIDWIESRSRDEQVPVYDEEDIFGEGEPVRYEVYNAGKEHVTQFREWIEAVEENGYTVKIEVI
jgi:hypothetical protein